MTDKLPNLNPTPTKPLQTPAQPPSNPNTTQPQPNNSALNFNQMDFNMELSPLSYP